MTRPASDAAFVRLARNLKTGARSREVWRGRVLSVGGNKCEVDVAGFARTATIPTNLAVSAPATVTVEARGGVWTVTGVVS